MRSSRHTRNAHAANAADPPGFSKSPSRRSSAGRTRAPRTAFSACAAGVKDTLFEAGARIEFLYFPLDSVISTITSMEDGSSVEVGIIGKEGATDVAVVLEDDISSHRGIVQLAGSALKLSAVALREELRRDGALRSVLLRYSRFALTQATQSAACNRLHSLEQRCARWLLSMRDRVEADTFPMTHEFLAYMLGVRRPGVTVAARTLRQAGLVRYARGQLTILDGDGLEAGACECHRVLKNELVRLLG
jgi:CRP-like cAMP-binding protein